MSFTVLAPHTVTVSKLDKEVSEWVTKSSFFQTFCKNNSLDKGKKKNIQNRGHGLLLSMIIALLLEKHVYTSGILHLHTNPSSAFGSGCIDLKSERICGLAASSLSPSLQPSTTPTVFKRELSKGLLYPNHGQTNLLLLKLCTPFSPLCALPPHSNKPGCPSDLFMCVIKYNNQIIHKTVSTTVNGFSVARAHADNLMHASSCLLAIMTVMAGNDGF